jgi:2-oxoglutarate dehydrogenase E2 component (dihydrolipoamide succinyltransferase)
MTTDQLTKTTLVLPSLGESVEEATVTRWLKKEGDYIEADRESTPRNLPAGRGQAAEGSNDVGHRAVEQLEGRCPVTSGWVHRLGQLFEQAIGPVGDDPAPAPVAPAQLQPAAQPRAPPTSSSSHHPVLSSRHLPRRATLNVSGRNPLNRQFREEQLGRYRSRL